MDKVSLHHMGTILPRVDCGDRTKIDMTIDETIKTTLSKAEKVVYAESLCAVLFGKKDYGIVYWGYYAGDGSIEWSCVADMLFATDEQKLEAYQMAKGLKKREYYL